MTTDVFKEFGTKIHNDKYIYTDKTIYISNKKKIIVTCKEHGEFLIFPNRHLIGQGCEQCNDYGKISEEFLLKCYEIYGENTYDFSKSRYGGSNVKIEVFCNICQKNFSKIPPRIISGHGCLACSKKIGDEKKHLTKEQFVEKAIKKHGDKYDYSEANYVNYNVKVTIICKIHGPFTMRPYNHLCLERGCDDCRPKTYSKKQIAWLTYLQQSTPFLIKHAENGGEVKIDKYYIDGFCVETKTCYEFNGDLFHGNPMVHDANEIHPMNGVTMGELYQKTINKEKKLISLGYNVISIWEYDWDIFVRELKRGNNDITLKNTNNIIKQNNITNTNNQPNNITNINNQPNNITNINNQSNNITNINNQSNNVTNINNSINLNNDGDKIFETFKKHLKDIENLNKIIKEFEKY